MEDSIADLGGLLDALDITVPVHLIGNSYGGTIALDFAWSTRIGWQYRVDRGALNVEGWAEQIAAERERVALVVAEMGEENLQAWIRRSAARWCA